MFKKKSFSALINVSAFLVIPGILLVDYLLGPNLKKIQGEALTKIKGLGYKALGGGSNKEEMN